MKNVSRGTSGSNPLYETSKLSQLHQDQNTKTRIQRMYQYPASVKQAEMHRKANEFGYNSKTTPEGKPAPLCPCCELPINTVRIKMKYGTTPSADHIKSGSDIFLLNAGSAMFFTFIKMTVVYLVLRFLLSDCYNLITNLLSTNCDIGDNVQLCKSNIFSKFSSYNKRTQSDEPYLYVLDILNLATIVCSIIFFFYYRKEQYEIYTIADLSNTSQADFSIFVENIPFFLPYDPETGVNSCLYEEQLKKVFEKEAKEWIKTVKQTEGLSNKLDASFYKLMKQKPSIEKGPIVRSVSLCFDLTEMQKLNQIRTNLMARHNENVSNGVVVDQKSNTYIPNQINCVNHEYIELSKKFSLDSSMAFSLSHFVGKAFVSFQYAHYQQYFLEYYKGTDKLKLADRTLKLGTASQPSDIYWFNMKVSNRQRLISMFYSGLIMFMSLCFSFAMLLGLQYYQLTSTSPSNPSQSAQQIILSYFFTLSMTVLTTIINYILAFTCQKLTEWERHNSKTDYIISLMTKSVISQFINTAFIYYMIGVVADLAHSKNASPLSENGIVTKVSSLVAVSGGIQIFLNAVQLSSTFSCLMNKIKIKGDTVNMFQVQLNQQMQDAEFAFSDRYTYYIVNVYIVSFFSYITPYTTIILVPIFIIQYWIDKYNLFQRFSCPTDFDFRLSRMTLKIFEISVLIFALGNYIFSFKIHATKEETQYHIINLVSLLLAVAYSLAIFLLPKKWFEKIEGQSYETISYTECLAQEKFNKVYWLTNPATSFAKEPDLNAPNKFVNYGHADQYAEAKDFEDVLMAELRGTYKIETYDKNEVQLAAEAFESIQKNIGTALVPQNSPPGEFDLFGRIAQAANK